MQTTRNIFFCSTESNRFLNGSAVECWSSNLAESTTYKADEELALLVGHVCQRLPEDLYRWGVRRETIIPGADDTVNLHLAHTTFDDIKHGEYVATAETLHLLAQESTTVPT